MWPPGRPHTYRERRGWPRWRVGRVGCAMTQVLRMMRWSQMSAAERAALTDRSIDHAVSPELREQIAALILDVRDRGDVAVCEALARFDGVEVAPGGLAVSEAE